MNIGKMDRLLRFERRTTVPHPTHGKPQDGWVPFHTGWASVQDVLPTGSAESETRGVGTVSSQSKVRIRYTTKVFESTMRIIDITPGRAEREMRLVTLPAEVGRREALDFMAEYSPVVGAA